MLRLFLGYEPLDLSLRILLGLSVWAVVLSIILAVSWLIARLIRTAATRSLLWTSVFFLFIAALPLDLFIPKPQFLCLNSPISQLFLRKTFVAPVPESPRLNEAVVSEAPMVFAPGSPLKNQHERRPSVWPRILLLMIAVIGMFMLARIARSWIQMHRLCQRSIPGKKRLQAIINSLGAELSLRGKLCARVTDELRVPATFGFFKPVLLIPRRYVGNLSSSSMTGILAHELAHVKRNDYIRNLLGYVVAAIFWFVPFIWLARREHRRDIELSCDDVAILHTRDRSAYADSLGALAMMSLGGSACSLGFADSRPAILMRVRAALENRNRRKHTSASARLVITAISGAFLSIVSLMSVGDARVLHDEPVGPIVLTFPLERSLGCLYKVTEDSKIPRMLIGNAQGNVRINKKDKIVLDTELSGISALSSLKSSVLKGIWGIAIRNRDLTGHDLEFLLSCGSLGELDLSNSGIGDEAVGVLTKMRWLRRLHLDRTGITDDGLAALRRKLPLCTISRPGHSIDALLARDAKRLSCWPTRWTVFGPFEKDDPTPDSSVLSTVPAQLQIGKRTLAAASVEAAEHGWVNLEPVMGERQEGKTGWIFGDVTFKSETVLTIWAAADWWMSWYVDGIPVYSSGPEGNLSTDYAYPNHSFKVRFSKGRHVLSARVTSGSRGWGISSAAIQSRPRDSRL